MSEFKMPYDTWIYFSDCSCPDCKAFRAAAKDTPKTIALEPIKYLGDSDPVAKKAYPDDNPKTVQGLKKPSFSAIPGVALVHLGAAMADGRRKYGPANWREQRVTASTYIDAASRHIQAWWDSQEEVASDSKVHHLAHAMACLAIILDAQEQGALNDDRPPPGKVAALMVRMTESNK